MPVLPKTMMEAPRSARMSISALDPLIIPESRSSWTRLCAATEHIPTIFPRLQYEILSSLISALQMIRSSSSVSDLQAYIQGCLIMFALGH